MNTKKQRFIQSQYEFREIRASETDAVTQIEQICFPPHEACTPKQMKERVAAVSEMFLVAVHCESGEIAGFLNGVATEENRFRDDFFSDVSLYQPTGKNVMILGLDVLPAYRMQGLATALVKQYALREKERDRERLILTCLEDKVPMYEKMGFIDQGLANSSWGGESWHEMYMNLS